MKKALTFVLLFFISHYSFSQVTPISDKAKIEIVVKEFIDCIVQKDSTRMYPLFYKGPVTWVGVYKETTQKERLKKDNLALGYKISDYKTWFRNVCKPEPRREDFHNIEIIEDGSVASVTFDYSFWVNNKKGNWGKEFWHLVNQNGNWKIASVVYSMELEGYKADPLSPQQVQNAQSDMVRKMATELMKVGKLPGLSIAIRKKDSIIFAEGFGFADLEKRTPVTPLTQFRAASTSKVMTATALAKMIQDGIIDVDLPIQKYVPSYPKKEYPITAKQLAGNISGMPHYLESDKNRSSYYSSIGEALKVFSHQPLILKPQTKYSYSSAGFVLLSAAMEGASGTRFLDYLQENVFNPLGMKSTEPEMAPYRLMPSMARLYELKNNEHILVDKTREMSAIWAAGGFVTTPTDLVNMTKAYSNGYLNPNTVEYIFQSQILESGEKTQVGIGWRRSFDMAGRNIIEHAGVSEGTRSVICYFPEEDMAISVITNMQWVSSIESTAHMLVAPFLEASKDQKQSTGLKGEYLIKAKLNEKEFKGRLKLNNGNGEIILDNGNRYSVFHLQDNVYSLITNQGIYSLTIDQNKEIVSGKAIMYQSQLQAAPGNLKPFFTFLSDK